MMGGGGNRKFYFDASTEFGTDKIWYFGTTAKPDPDHIYVCGGTAQNPPTYTSSITGEQMGQTAWTEVSFEYVVSLAGEEKGKIRGHYILRPPRPASLDLDNVNISTLPATHADCSTP